MKEFRMARIKVEWDGKQALTAAFGSGIKQSSASCDGDDAQDRGNRDGVVLGPADLNRPHIHCLLLARIGEASVDECGHSGKNQQYSSDLHTFSWMGREDLPAAVSEPPAGLLCGLEQVVILDQLGVALLAIGFFVSFVRGDGIVLGVVNRILQLANAGLNFALDLLDGAFHFGLGVAERASDMTLGVSYGLVYCALYCVLVHFFTPS
jgi:hypothetical protein